MRSANHLIGSALVALASGCLFSPANESVVASKETSLTFEGVTGLDRTAFITASSSAAGTFEDVIELDADAAGAFSGSSAVPVWLWRPLCDRTGGWETFVRADNPERTGHLLTFDDEDISGIAGEDCVDQHIEDGDYLGALFECGSQSSPVARVRASAGGTGPIVFEGDIVIDSPDDADGLECVQTLDGSLTVDDGVFADITLPSLQVITGDVSLVFEREANLFGRTEVIHLPALHTVGGDVALHAVAAMNGQTARDRFGMHALTSVGGDVSIEIDAFNCTPSGFASLTTIAGSVTYDSCSADGSGAGLFPALVSIETDLDVTFGGSTQELFFGDLVTVGGDLTATGGTWNVSLDGTGRMFTALTTVIGTLHAIDVHIFGATPRAFDALAQVGTLDWDSGGTMELIGADAVALDGLRFHDNAWLTELTTLMSKYTIGPSAPITITDNEGLPECDAQAWVAALPGHTGPVTISGNLACSRPGDPEPPIQGPGRPQPPVLPLGRASAQ
jgi:hypothetical protein